MNMVQMTQLVTDTDAWRAALASILEMDLDDVPEFDGMAADMQFDAWLAGQLNLARFKVSELYAPPPGFWLARVVSPYPGYKVHTLVMQGPRVVFDPHPEPQHIDVTGGVLMCEMLLPLDPAQPSGRLAV